MDKQLTTRQDVLVQLGRTRFQITGSFKIRTLICFSSLLPLSTPGPNGQRIEYHTRCPGSVRTSGCGEQEAGVASGSGWKLWVWL